MSSDGPFAPRRLTLEERAALRVYRMLAELHRRGYERLRIVPGMSSSGCYYRSSVTSADNVFADHGALAVENDLVAHNTSGNGARLFAWPGAARASIAKLATIFVERFPEIAERGFGPDPEYADWFVLAVDAMKHGHSPLGYADYDLPGTSPPRCMPTTESCRESCLPMPPRGASGRNFYRESAENELTEECGRRFDLVIAIGALDHLNRIA